MLLVAMLTSNLAAQDESRNQLLENPAEPATATTESRLSKTADFIRMTESEDGKPLTLDTAVVTYQRGTTATKVDLIGAVHIGEAAYYEELNQLFDQYDVLLYELVAPEGTVIQKNTRSNSDNPISFLQNATKSFLGMESQLEKIDYTKPHFLRADMTPEQIAEKMQSRGENMLTLALSALLDAMRQQNQAASDSDSAAVANQEMDILEMLQNPQQARIMMARQFAGTDNLDLALGGSLNQLLVVDRNAEALKVLNAELSKGHERIGIFYGAAHLPDLEKHLIDDFRFSKKETRWVKAWDLNKPAESTQPLDPISAMLNLLKDLK